jgi:hypothetical protein
MKIVAGVAIALLTALTAPAHAYTHILRTGDGQPRRWPSGAQPIAFQINQDTNAGLPNIQPGSQPLAAIGRALAAWPAAAAIAFTDQLTSVESVGADGVNLVTLKNTAANRMAIEMAGSPLGLTIVRSQGDNIVEADIVFNPAEAFSTIIDTDEELQEQDWHDLESVAAHELGHAIGLHHTGVESATMWALSSVLQRSLDADDRAGARALYPIAPAATIGGQVTVGGAPAFGAHVVALRDGRVAASALSRPDGSYVIEGLLAGSYVVYVEPLDGPHSTIPTDPCARLGNISGGGIYSGAVLDTDFGSRFFGGNMMPTSVAVAAGGQAQVSFALAPGPGSLNPTLIGPARVDGGNISLRVGGNAIELVAGRRHAVAVAGRGLDTVSSDGIGFGDSSLDFVPNSLAELSINCNGTNLPVLVFEVDVDAGAISGSRSLLLRGSGDVSMMTGAVDVRGAEPPTPTPVMSPTPTMTSGSCVGDCDGNGLVTVDEIVTMVNVALGIRPVTTCPAGDTDGSGTITVDEILTAIRNALTGC